MIKVYGVERDLEYRRWATEIQFIKFPDDWEIKIVPPFGGAIIRFIVKRKGIEEPKISVYLDCYDNLGSVGKPYWEIYPYKGDTYRCLMGEVDDLLDAIGLALGNKRVLLNNKI